MWGEIFNRNLLLAFVESIINFDIAKLLKKSNQAKSKTENGTLSEKQNWSFFSITGFIFFWVATVATKFMIGATVAMKDASGAIIDDDNLYNTAVSFDLTFQRLQFADQSQIIQLYFWMFIIFSASFLVLKPLIKDQGSSLIFIEASAMIAFISMIIIIISISILNALPSQMLSTFNNYNFRKNIIPQSWLSNFLYCSLVAFLLGIISIYKNNDMTSNPGISFRDIIKWLLSVFTVVLIASVILFVSVSMKINYA